MTDERVGRQLRSSLQNSRQETTAVSFILRVTSPYITPNMIFGMAPTKQYCPEPLTAVWDRTHEPL